MISALNEDLDNVIVDALDYTDDLGTETAIDHLMDILPMQIGQIVDDLTSVDEYCVRDILEESIRKIATEQAQLTYKHLIRRHLLFFLDRSR